MADMDVTPQLIEQFDFAEKFRGYDPDQVDDFLERVGATLTRLGDELKAQTERAERAEAALADARSRLEAAPAPAPAPEREPDDVEQATSTLVLAKRTAEAAINEARGEANKLLTEARAEADRFVAEARARRDEMMKEARDKAEAEFAGQSEARRNEIGELDTAKKGLGDDISILEGRLAEYRKNLADVHSRLGQLLEDPESLKAKAPLDVDMAPTPLPATTAASPFYSTSSNPVVEVDRPTEAVDASEVSVVSSPDEAGESSDPWGPGSWSEVSAALGDEPGEATVATATTVAAEGTEAASADDPDVFRPAAPVVESVATSQEETGDRYLQELHEAVNVEEGDDDPAMDEFFDGRDERPKRFGRRR
jgi:DivIVA domain-containing protein